MNKFKHMLMGKRLSALAEVIHSRVNWDVICAYDIEVFIKELEDIHGYLLVLEKDPEGDEFGKGST